MQRRTCWLRAVLLLAFIGLAASSQSAAQIPERKRDPKVEDWKPATLPADALAYGAALDANAPTKLKKWCDNYSQKEMPKQKIDPRATMAVVDKEFASASDEARDATIFLLDYLSYKHEDQEQIMLAQRIRQLDDQAYDLTRRMIVLKENQERGMSTTSKNQAAAAPDAFKAEEDLRNLEQQLRELAQDRKMKMGQLDAHRKRVDGYLKVMSVTYPRMNGVEPQVLRTMQ
jgi:hypothetical protein